MMIIPLITAILFLLIISIYDIKLKEIPSTITTLFIVFELLLIGTNGLFVGAIFFLLSMLLIDYEWFSGGADLKVMVALGILITDVKLAVTFFFIFLSVGLISKLTIKQYYPKLKEIPFIPIITISFTIFCFIFGSVV